MVFKPVLQGGIYARLPAGAGGAEAGDHVGGRAHRDLPLAAVFLGAATLPHGLAQCSQIGCIVPAGVWLDPLFGLVLYLNEG